MTAYFDRFRTLRDRHGEEPKSKGAAAAIRQARISSSVVLGAMTVVMATLLMNIFSGPFADLELAQRAGTGSVAMKDVEPPPAASGVKVVSAQPKLDVPCEEQTWPYIDRRCLTESTKAPSKTPWRDPQEKKQQQKTATTDLDPRSAAPAVIPRADASTDGVAPRDASEPKSPTSETQQAALADSAEGNQIQGVPAVATTGSASPRGAAASQSGPEQMAAIIPLPVARPAGADAAPAAVTAEAPNTPVDVAEEDRRQEAQKEKPRRRASRRHRNPGQRIVREWRELIYDLPGGGSRRVMIFPRGMF